MNEKSIMPLKSFSDYSPPFRYSAFFELQLNFSKLCQTKILEKKSIPNKDDTNKLSSETQSPDLPTRIKKSVPPKQYKFGEINEEVSYNKTNLIKTN